MVGSEYSYNIRANLGKSMIDDDDERSEISIELDINTNIMSSVTDTLYPVVNGMYQYELFEIKKKLRNIEPIVTTDHLSKMPPSLLSSDPESIIDGYTLKWPKFGINNAIFEGTQKKRNDYLIFNNYFYIIFFILRSIIYPLSHMSYRFSIICSLLYISN
jgi:hypothetical protein